MQFTCPDLTTGFCTTTSAYNLAFSWLGNHIRKGQLYVRILFKFQKKYVMKNFNEFTPLTEKEALEINGGGALDGILDTLTGVVGAIPVLGPILATVLNLVKGLLGNLPLPV